MEPLSQGTIKQLLGFLPFFREGRVFYSVDPNISWFDPYLYTPEVDQFVHLLYEFDVIDSSFDWPAWQLRAARYVAEPALVAKARSQTLRKLLTVHVRKERFCSGHLAAMIDAGHIRAILERFEVLSRQAPHPKQNRLRPG